MSLKLTKKQVREIESDESEEFEGIEIIEGEDRRWSRTNTIIFKQNSTEKHFSLYYEEGLTENQDNEYESQECPEVECIEETIVVKKWVNVK